MTWAPETICDKCGHARQQHGNTAIPTSECHADGCDCLAFEHGERSKVREVSTRVLRYDSEGQATKALITVDGKDHVIDGHPAAVLMAIAAAHRLIYRKPKGGN